MKKLLALVLCVMMVLSLAPAAFANPATTPAHPELDTGLLAPAQSAAANKKAVTNAKANIEYMYGALAADNAVFGTVKAIDSVISSFAKELFADVDFYRGLTGSKLEGNTKTVLRDYIGSEIIRDLIKNRSDYETASTSYKVTLADGTLGSLTYTGKQTQNGGYIYIDKDGNIYGFNGGWWIAPEGTTITDACFDNGGNIVDWEKDTDNTVQMKTEYKYNPVAYANAFASAATKAMTSKEGASMLEALAYQLYSAKVYHDIDEKFDDLYDEIVDWEDGSAILSQYHFHDTTNANWPYGIDDDGIWSPYAMLDYNDYPNAMSVPAAIFAP
jgi:hypothetical protein